MKVLFLTNLPSPYMVNFLNELGKICNLTVLFERGESSERNGRWDCYKFDSFDGIILKGIPMSPDSALAIGVLKWLKNKYDYIIIANPMTPTGILAQFFLKMKKIPFILESEGSFHKSGVGIKEKLKFYLVSNASCFLSTTAKADEYFEFYGAERKKIFHYPFTSLYERDILERVLDTNEKEKLRKEFVIRGTKLVTAVGRLIKLKNYNILLEAWGKIRECDWSLAIIGEGEEEATLKEYVKTNNLLNVYFVGYKDKKTVMEYLKASDIFVHPTSTDVWGLVINEAMACGQPIITTDMCIAGSALIEDGVNGYIVKVGDSEAIKNKIEYILQNEDICKSMGENSLHKIKKYTYEEMAASHLRILNQEETRKYACISEQR